MITATSNYYDVVSQMQEGDVRVFHNVAWDEYEELLEQVGEARGLRISYNDGTLKVMSLSLEHEKYATFITRLMSQLSFRLRINILFSGSTTMRKKKKSKGNEPDAGFYIQTASVVGNRLNLDFEVDPPPDVVVEIDIHHDSTGSDPTYAALGVPEIWRYDGLEATIYHLQGNGYVGAEASNALPMITSAILTEYLTRMKEEGEKVLKVQVWHLKKRSATKRSRRAAAPKSSEAAFFKLPPPVTNTPAESLTALSSSSLSSAAYR